MSNYVKTTTIKQNSAIECGAASLAMVLNYFGKDASLEKIAAEMQMSVEGVSAGDIVRTAEQMGVECKGFRVEINVLPYIHTPCIMHWNYCHFVVFEGIKNEYAYINDPAVGRRRLSYDEILKGFTGVVLLVSIDDSEN